MLQIAITVKSVMEIFESELWRKIIGQLPGWLGVIIAIVGLVLVMFTLCRQRELKQAAMLREHGALLLSCPGLMEAEQVLRSSEAAAKAGADGFTGEDARAQVLENLLFHTAYLTASNEGKQQLVGYLTYLEACAQLVLAGKLRLRDVDSLFGNRYFMAVNNPAVQALLLSCPGEYSALRKLYRKWVLYRRAYGGEIPLKTFALPKVLAMQKKVMGLAGKAAVSAQTVSDSCGCGLIYARWLLDTLVRGYRLTAGEEENTYRVV